MMRRESVGNDHFLFMDSSDILGAARGNRKWTNFQRSIHTLPPVAQFERDVVLGSESYVRRSEEFLASIEDQMPLSKGWRNMDDVVGAVPNVPSYLAGHPQCMRRRQRVDKDTAPVTIFMNLSSSMSIPPEKILQRGIVLLALARLLTIHRSVELWVGSALSDGRQSGTVAWRIDTAPLDLARASYHIADVSMSRMFAYAMCEQLVDKHLGDRPGNESQHNALLRKVAGWGDVVMLPPISYSDPMVDRPVEWLRQAMAKYTGQETET